MTHSLDQLLEFLRIPSVSTQPEFAGDCLAAQIFLKQLFLDLGLFVKILPAKVHGTVFASTPIHPGLPTVLVYGHYDVQPAGAPSAWTTPAFEPNIRKNRIYARGATDNKGQLMIHIMSIKDLISKFGINKLPLNFKFIIEGEEEIGSPSVEMLLNTYPDLFSTDYLILSDTEMVSPGHPSIDVSLRGVLDLELEVQTSQQDLHSGQFGGLAPNPAIILSHLISKLKNGNDRITLPEFYKDIVPLTSREISDFKLLEPNPEDLLKDGHFFFLSRGDSDVSLNRRRWSEPTFDVTGLESGYSGQGTKNIIPDSAKAKLSFRLVPNQNPEKIYSALVNFLQRNVPNKACLRIFAYPYTLPYKAPTKHPVYTLAKKSLEEVFGHQSAFVGQGGSIGFVPVFAKTLEVPCVLIGFGLPDENVHAPNEHFSLENFEQGITAMSLIYSRLPSVKIAS